MSRRSTNKSDNSDCAELNTPVIIPCYLIARLFSSKMAQRKLLLRRLFSVRESAFWKKNKTKQNKQTNKQTNKQKQKNKNKKATTTTTKTKQKTKT